MRQVAIVVVIAACGGAPVAPVTPVVAPASAVAPVHGGALEDKDTPPVDALAALGKDLIEVSFVVPKVASLDVGGIAINAPEGQPATAVALFEKHGLEIRVGVWLETARFALWTDKQWLLGTIAHDVRVTTGSGGDFVDYSQRDPVEALLHAGAHVRRLGHKEHETQIRYLGAVEVDGWIPDDALADRGPATQPSGRFYGGRQTLTAPPGSVIRAETKWGSRTLAVMANGYFVDTIAEVDDNWVEVGYEDSEVRVHGYYGRHEPPERTHKPHADDAPPAPTTPNALASSGTCLYAKERGEPVGFVVGDRQVELSPGNAPGWWALRLDTPWGPIVFAAEGPTLQDLTACAPAGSVPPPGPTLPVQP